MRMPLFWLRHHKSTSLIDQIEGMATGSMVPFRLFKASRLLIEAGLFTTVDDGNHRVRCAMGTDGHGQPFDAIAQPTA